jgi:UTP--glucose-1-phosphate uridylyltransferase
VTAVKKAVIPAAGLGTRFLPLTRSLPKEMLPVVHKPVIQYVIEEALNSGIKDILVITGRGKRAIEDYFDKSDIKPNNGNKYLNDIDEILNKINIFYVRQKELKGLGSAVMHAEPFVDDDPFALMLGDTITRPPCTKELIGVYNKYKTSIIGVEEVPINKVHFYGIVSGQEIDNNIYSIHNLVEKPTIEEAPSNLAILGEYILTPDIFNCIKKTKPGKYNEIQLTDALKVLNNETKIHAYLYKGKRYDIGNKIDWLKANIELGLEDPELGNELQGFVRGLMLDTE